MKKQELRDLICEVLGLKQIPPMIERQINKFVLELGLSYKEIARAIVFYIEVEAGDYEPKYGIGIVPSVVDRANEYYERKKREKEKQIESVKKAESQPNIILKVSNIRKRRKLNTIKIEEIDVD